jgi:hypothetical protein
MKELHEAMAPYVARLRKLGVTGDIMILPTVNDAVAKDGRHDPRQKSIALTQETIVRH